MTGSVSDMCRLCANVERRGKTRIIIETHPGGDQMNGCERSPCGCFLNKKVQGWGKYSGNRAMAACGACGQVFPNRLQVGAHARTCRAIRHFLQPPITDQVDLDAEDADIAPITLHSLARRPSHPWGIECDVAMPDLPVGNSPFTRDYRPVSSKCVASIFFYLVFFCWLCRCRKYGAHTCKIVSMLVIPNSGFCSQLYRMKVPLAATEFLRKSKT